MMNVLHDKHKEYERLKSVKEVNRGKFAMNPENLAVKVFAKLLWIWKCTIIHQGKPPCLIPCIRI